MIQRIQTLWLLIAATLTVLTFKFSVYSGNMLSADGINKEYVELKSTGNMLLLIVSITLAIAIIYSIFLFKKRMMQFWFTLLAVVISLLNIYLFYAQTLKFEDGNYNLATLAVLAIPLFLLFAMRGIWKDEKLVKSLDRLR